MSHPLDYINTSRLEAELRELLTIPSLGGTPAEVDAQRFVANVFQTDGFEVDTWDIDVAATIEHPDFPGQEVERSAGLGVFACLPGTDPKAPTLLINGHTDVVPVGDENQWSVDPFGGAIGDLAGKRVIYGRGATDMKAGVIAGMVAMRAIKESGMRLPGTIAMVPVSGEEDGGFGTFAALDHGVRADACIITEPTELNIIPANGGALTFKLTVPGLNAHASNRTAGVSAIEKFHLIHDALMDLEAKRNSAVDPIMSVWPLAYPLSFGTINSGDWASTVPDQLIATGRIGVALGETNEQAKAALEQAVRDVCTSDSFLSEHPVTVIWWGGQFASGQTPSDHQLVQTLTAMHAHENGHTPKIFGAPYGSDLRLLVGAGIPTVQYGPGHLAQAHAPDECVRIDEVIQCARTLVLTALSFCR